MKREKNGVYVEKRNRSRELVKRIARMSEAERAVLADGIPTFTVDGHILSVRNLCLIALQAGRRAVTQVGGFAQWKRHGRSVCRGEHGFSICFPRFRKGDDDTGDVCLSGFGWATVFDIAQTEERIA